MTEIDNGWKVKIVDTGTSFLLDIYIYSRGINNVVSMVTSDGKVVSSIQEHGTRLEPTIRLERQQLQAFSNALNNMGINPQKEYIQGKLEATENHLQDMRTLLKIKNK